MAAQAHGETFSFEAEVSRLLKLMVHSVYSEREIFLRELISNASDACDKLRHAALTQPALTEDGSAFRIDIRADPQGKTITVSDNGIGMNRDELIAHLGTIARSGTAAFLEQLAAAGKADLQLIGQFGVGFYSVFMAADRVTVLSRRAGEDQAWRWTSDGEGSYRIEPDEKATRGTDVTLHLKADAGEFLEKARLERIVRTYSDHIAMPIRLAIGDGALEAANSGTALWTRPKADIEPAQYAEFYRHISGAFDAPAFTLHFRAEGRIDYTALLFVPGQPPFDLYDPARKSRVKLYVKRVFITDDCADLLPGYLRFLRGVVDSQDLPLNISREMLQNNPLVAAMRKAIVSRLLADLNKFAAAEPESYESIWANFGRVLKEGLYEDADRRKELLALARFKSTTQQGWTTLADYAGRMQPGQTAIYVIRGDDETSLKRSPQLEGFRARGIEVLLLADPIDDFWVDAVGDYDGKPLRSVTRAGDDLKGLGPAPDAPAQDDAAVAGLIAALKAALEDEVKDIRASTRLTDSAVCLVADEAGLDLHLERMLRQHEKLTGLSPRILEINPAHPLIEALAARAGAADTDGTLADAAHLLLDQARILEGEALADPAAFAQRLNAMMARLF